MIENLERSFFNFSIYLVLISVAIMSSINHSILYAVVFALLCFILILKKTVNIFLVTLPFMIISLIPSTFVVSLTLSTPIGSVRPAMLVLISFIFIYIFLNFKSIDISLLKENKYILTSIFIFFIYALLLNIVTNFNTDNFRVTLISFVLSFVIFIFVQLFYKNLDPKNVIKMTIAISSIVSILGILEFFKFQPYLNLYMLDRDYFSYDSNLAQLPRVVSSIGNPIILSGYLLLCVHLIIYMRMKNPNNLFYRFAMYIHFICIFMTMSRSTMGLSIIILLIYIIKEKSILYIFKSLFYGGLFAVISLTLAYKTRFFNLIIDRIIFDNDDISFNVRNDALNLAMEIYNNSNPFYGVGNLAIGEYLIKNYNFQNATLENVFLSVLVGLGMIGLILFITIFISIYMNVKNFDDNLKFTIYLLLASFICLASFTSLLSYDVLWGVFWYILGIFMLDNKSNRDTGL